MKLFTRFAFIIVVLSGVFLIADGASADAPSFDTTVQPYAEASLAFGVGSAQTGEDADVSDLPTTGRGTGVTEDTSTRPLLTWQTIRSVLILGLVASLAFGGLALHARYQRL